jgi:HlyD family secretion protein
MKRDLSKLNLALDEKVPKKRARRIVPVMALISGLMLSVLLILYVAGIFEQVRDKARGDGNGTTGQPTVKRNSDAFSHLSPELKADVMVGGYVEAKRSAVLVPGRDGVISTVHVRRGQQVKQGDLLLELDTEKARADIDMAEAELARKKAQLNLVQSGSRKEDLDEVQAQVEQATADMLRTRKDFERVSQLKAGSVAEADVVRAQYLSENAQAFLKALQARQDRLRQGNRPQEIDAAVAEVASAEASLRKVQAHLELSYLRAPFDGIVAQMELEPGEVISLMNSQGEEGAIEVADTTELRVKVDIPEARLHLIRLGAAAELVLDALDKECVRGEVVEIDPVAQKQSNTVSVWVRIITPPALVRPNMSARVRIEISDNGETK